MLTRLTMVLGVIGLLVFAASTLASGRDANRDRIPDRWEKRHGLALSVNQARQDQDADGFKNRAEWRAGTDPRDADSDNDGISDDDENAGTVTAYANGDLTIALFDSGQLSGKVTEATRVECDDDDDASPSHDGDDEGHRGARQGDDDARGDNDDDGEHSRGDGDHGDGDGDHGDGDHGDGDHGDGECADGALKVGATVEEAELKITSAGRVWKELRLR